MTTSEVEETLNKHWSCPTHWNGSGWEFACGPVLVPEPGEGYTAMHRRHIANAVSAQDPVIEFLERLDAQDDAGTLAVDDWESAGYVLNRLIEIRKEETA
jgi:hypothetical protein